MLSRFFLILTGLLVGLWLRGGGDVVTQFGLPSLALLALLLAIAAAPGPVGSDTRIRLEASYRSWLEAWQRMRAAAGRERPEAEEELASATRALAVGAPDRVLRALLAAERNGFASHAVAQLVIEMRRSIGRPSLTLRPAELERLLDAPIASVADKMPAHAASSPDASPVPAPDPAPRPAPDPAPGPSPDPSPDPVSFLS